MVVELAQMVLALQLELVAPMAVPLVLLALEEMGDLVIPPPAMVAVVVVADIMVVAAVRREVHMEPVAVVPVEVARVFQRKAMVAVVAAVAAVHPGCQQAAVIYFPVRLMLQTATEMDR